MDVELLTRGSLDRRSVLRSGALVGGGIAAAALIGCGSDDNASTDATPGTAASATPTQVVQVPGYDVAGKRIPYNFPETKQPKNGGTVVVGTTWEPSTFDTTKS